MSDCIGATLCMPDFRECEGGLGVSLVDEVMELLSKADPEEAEVIDNHWTNCTGVDTTCDAQAK